MTPGNPDSTRGQAAADRLPEGAKPYRRTDVFTEATVPAALLKEHRTKPGTWGLIHVTEGTLVYTVTDASRAAAERMLTPAVTPGVVEPGVLHQVRPVGSVRFYVEFFRVHSPHERIVGDDDDQPKLRDPEEQLGESRG